MVFRTTPIAGAFVVELEPRQDDRGFFARSFCPNEFDRQGISFKIAQCNLAYTKKAGIVRGLHYHDSMTREQKLVRCVVGEVLDVIIDMRPDSSTRHQVFSTTLSPRNRLAVFIPAGVAHGYQTLTDETEFFYMTDDFYTPGHEKGVRYNDPALNITWPLPPHGVTERDQIWPLVNS